MQIYFYIKRGASLKQLLVIPLEALYLIIGQLLRVNIDFRSTKGSFYHYSSNKHILVVFTHKIMMEHRL